MKNGDSGVLSPTALSCKAFCLKLPKFPCKLCVSDLQTVQILMLHHDLGCGQAGIHLQMDGIVVEGY